MIVKIPNTKTKVPRSFTVDGAFRLIVAKYEALRPSRASSDRFFLNYQKGKCTMQPIGINKFGKMPSDIANYLKLTDADLYTGHSFRRTSATLLADSGADLTTLKRHGGWKSSTVAEGNIRFFINIENIVYLKACCSCFTGYIEDSTNYKRQIGNQIASTINLAPSILNENDETEPTSAKIPKMYEIEPNCTTLNPTYSAGCAESESSAGSAISAISAISASSASIGNPITIHNYTNCTITITK